MKICIRDVLIFIYAMTEGTFICTLLEGNIHFKKLYITVKVHVCMSSSTTS